MHVVGIGGPRAPHVFEFDRRANLGCFGSNYFAVLSFVFPLVLAQRCQWSEMVAIDFSGVQRLKNPISGESDAAAAEDRFWQLPPHRNDVILRIRGYC